MQKVYQGCRPGIYSLSKAIGNCRRGFSHHHLVKVSEEVQEGVKSGQPVVALESTIITHGLPYPENMKLAKEAEAKIRSKGAIPATIALINGVPSVGINHDEIHKLASGKKIHKVSRRDIGYCIASKISGGTTISGTMILANLCGIRVFATGGLGGVHRGVNETLDISTDLEELGQTPVSVVCAGPKAILDIERTLEYLETKGVYVSTYGPQGTNIPGFFTHDSGFPSPFNFQNPEDAANVIAANLSLGLNTGNLFCIPAPSKVCLDPQIVDEAINQAVIDAEEARIKGKDLTPFLLNRIWHLTEGESVKTNIALVLNNVSVASDIAIALSNLGKF